MRIQPTRFQVWAAVALALAAVLWGTYSYRHRFVRVDADLLGLLPPHSETQFFINAAALRRGRMLKLLMGKKTAQEADYGDFIKQTHFDYTTDVDALAGVTDSAQIWMTVRGRFDWGKLRAYAASHEGSCRDGICRAPTSKPGRWASFIEIQPDVLGLGLSGDADAAEELRPRDGRRGPQQMPGEPVWVRLSPGLLKKPMSLPQPVRIFAISLQSAEPVVLSLDGMKSGEASFELRLNAQCPSEATAETIRNQLEIETKMLKLELARERQEPSAADLTGLLTSGAFQVVHDRVIGTWPVRQELLRTLE